MGIYFSWQHYTTLERYVKYFNEQRPCYALNYDTPAGFRKRFFRGETPRKNTFEQREISEEPKFVKKYRKQAYLKDVSTFENEND